MPQIKAIQVRRFKRLTDIHVDLGTTTVLIGANNAGKSSILQAIQFAVSLAQSAKLIGGVNWAADKYELSFSQTQLLYCPISDAMQIASGGELVEDPSQRVEIRFELASGDSALVTLRKGRNRNLKVAIEGQILGTTLQDLASPFSIYAPGLAGVPRTEAFMSQGMVSRTVARGDANLVLRNVLLLLKKAPAKWGQFISDMRALFPSIELEVSFIPEQDEHITAKCALDGGPTVPLDAAGTSVLQASQILGYVALFQPKLLVLDEPDSHLHPDRQRSLCKLILDLAEEREFQVVMSTHSRHVLDAMRRRARVVWLNRGSRVDDTDIDTTQMLLDLGALDSVDYMADGHTKCVVATEDAHQEFIRSLLEASGFPDEETEIVSYPGCSQVEAALVLAAFLSDKAPHVRLVVHRDRDYLPQEVVETFETRLRGRGVEPFVTSGSDIESYFLNPRHLAELNPPLTEADVQQLLDQATTDVRVENIKAIVNLRTEQAFKKRAQTGDKPNHGEIAVTAASDYEANVLGMRRGDLVLSRLKSLIQQQRGSNPSITTSTPHLANAELQAIKQRIWSGP